ncbi:MAG: type II toxin-antitoxin system Phd/YefM family antitoxin [Pseudomonadota bacterium]
MDDGHSIADARNNLARLVHIAEDGEAVRLTRRGRPIAVILSLAEYERLRAAGDGLWDRLQRFRDAVEAETPAGRGGVSWGGDEAWR